MAKLVYEWIAAGEEWSEPWGGSAAQWFGSILPRIHACLPANTILEIASGFGRWSNYLKDHCRQLYLVDPAADCIEACRSRFAGEPQVICHVNDGRSLDMIPNGSIDFVFSFDSLVHVQREILEAYLAQLAEKLMKEGRGFIHHSNLGEYASSITRRARKLVSKGSVLGADHQRDPEMTAELFRVLCEQHGLKCLSQELLNWRGRRLIDCFSTIARRDSKWQPASAPFRNPNFMLEARLIRRRSQSYPQTPQAT
jgi:SAM-dependent methyltransferase